MLDGSGAFDDACGVSRSAACWRFCRMPFDAFPRPRRWRREGGGSGRQQIDPLRRRDGPADGGGTILLWRKSRAGGGGEICRPADARTGTASDRAVADQQGRGGRAPVRRDPDVGSREAGGGLGQGDPKNRTPPPPLCGNQQRPRGAEGGNRAGGSGRLSPPLPRRLCPDRHWPDVHSAANGRSCAVFPVAERLGGPPCPPPYQHGHERRFLASHRLRRNRSAHRHRNFRGAGVNDANHRANRSCCSLELSCP